MALTFLALLLVVGLPGCLLQRGKEGSACTLPTADTGVCARLSQCTRERRIGTSNGEMFLCASSNGGDPVVCCARGVSVARRSLDAEERVTVTTEEEPAAPTPLPLTLSLRPGPGSQLTDWPDDDEEPLPVMPLLPLDDDDDMTLSQRILDGYQQGSGGLGARRPDLDVPVNPSSTRRPSDRGSLPSRTTKRPADYRSTDSYYSTTKRSPVSRPSDYNGNVAHDHRPRRPPEYTTKRSPEYSFRPLDLSSRPSNLNVRPNNNQNNNLHPSSITSFDFDGNQATDFATDPDFSSHPSDFNSRPSNFNSRPSGFNSRPSGFNSRPSDFSRRPSDFNRRPSDFNSRPSDLNSRPPTFTNRPSDFNRPSDLNNNLPSEFNNRPIEPTSRPNEIQSFTRPSVWGPPTPEPAKSERTTPRGRRKMRISQRKCAEYASLQTETVAALPLQADAEPAVIQVQKCEKHTVPLIVGGRDANLHEFPHMVAIGYLDKAAGGRIEWNCGGTLISEMWVLTAGHCTATHLGRPVRVRLGEHNLASSLDGAYPQDVDVSSTVRHPNYKPPARYDDIALLRLAKKVHFNPAIRPACLYSADELEPDESLIATGWGHTESGGEMGQVLQKVVLNQVEHNTCSSLYSADAATSFLARGIVDSQLCAGYLSGGKDTCQGDSGGPLQVTSRNNRCVYHVVGITSFGKLCGARNSAGVYTRVSKYLSWIERYVWPLERKVEE